MLMIYYVSNGHPNYDNYKPQCIEDMNYKQSLEYNPLFLSIISH